MLGCTLSQPARIRVVAKEKSIWDRGPFLGGEVLSRAGELLHTVETLSNSVRYSLPELAS